MALNFPPNPTDGQIYPVPAPPGVTQYVYNGTKGTWLTVSQGVNQVRGESPITVKGARQNPIVSMPVVTEVNDGYMTAVDKQKLDALVQGVKGVTAGVGLGAPATGDTITNTGTINLLPPSGARIGGVYAGSTMTIASDGAINARPASTVYLGVVRAGDGLQISEDGTLSVDSAFIPLRDISPGFNGIQVSFTLQRFDGTVFTPKSINSLMIFVGGIFQIPGNAFSVLGSTLTFTSPPPAGAAFYGVAFG